MPTWLLFIVVALPFINTFDEYLFDYPTEIAIEPKRIHNNEIVSSGRLKALLKHGNEHFPPIFENIRSWNGQVHPLNKVNYSTFKDILQCAKAEPLNENFHLLKLIPLTQYNLEIFCAWMETSCRVGGVDPNSCAEIRRQILEGTYILNNFRDKIGYWDSMHINGFQTPTMLRIYNGTLYFDWPWLSNRLLKLKKFYNDHLDHIRPFHFINSYISDIGNSVFVMGNEWPVLNIRMPMPYFSYASSTKYGDTAWPWQETWNHAYKVYKRGIEENKYIKIPTLAEWSKRVPKAALYATYISCRALLFEIGAQRPDLIEAYAVYSVGTLRGWNPRNNQSNIMENKVHKYVENKDKSVEKYSKEVGYADSVYPVLNLKAKSYSPSNYKYLIVPLGMEGMTTSGRLASYLIESNAVILLQDGNREFGYHFSDRLKPYVHYVPISRDGADLVDKIEWLQRNDHLAYQIAMNGQNFAQSYLRFEDLLCFAAYAVRQSGNYATEEAKTPSKNPIPALSFSSLNE